MILPKKGKKQNKTPQNSYLRNYTDIKTVKRFVQAGYRLIKIEIRA